MTVDPASTYLYGRAVIRAEALPEAPLDSEVAALLASAPASAPARELGPKAMRELTEHCAALMEPSQEPGTKVVGRPGSPRGCRVYEPLGGAAGTIVHLHGGGWVVGSPELVEGTSRRLAAAAGARVVALNYRLAPEHPYPAPLEDCVAGVQWVAAQEDWRGPIALIGESAGANLALAAARRLPAVPAALALVVPAVDPSLSTRSSLRFAEGFGLTRDDMEWYWEQYVPDPSARAHGDVAPLNARLGGLPATLVVTAGWDILRDEGAALVDHLMLAGVAVEHDHRPELTHDFPWTTGASAPAAARRAATDVGTWLGLRIDEG